VKFEIFEIDPDTVIEQIADLAADLDTEGWTNRDFATCVFASVMANVAYSLYTTLQGDRFTRYSLAEAARRAFETALAEADRP
jgi:hypothetical protein